MANDTRSVLDRTRRVGKKLIHQQSRFKADRRGSKVSQLLGRGIEGYNGTLPVVYLPPLFRQPVEVDDRVPDHSKPCTVFKYQRKRERCD